MRILYEKLLAGESYKESSAKNYLESLADSIIALFPGDARIRLEAKIADIPIDAKRLFLLGIIVNELLTNIMKHAFAGRETGLIAIALDRTAGRVRLTVQDDGVGLSEGWRQASPAGLRLGTGQYAQPAIERPLLDRKPRRHPEPGRVRAVTGPPGNPVR